MQYYRAIKNGAHDYFTGYTTIKNELLTARERNLKFRYISDDCFQLVNINKNNTFFCFGARFETGKH